MLVLSRKKGEKIRIGEDIIIEVLDFNNSTVKLGFTASAKIKIYRDELYTKIIEENKKATEINENDISEIIRELKK